MQRNIKVGKLELSMGIPANGTGSLLKSSNQHKYFEFDEKQNDNALIRKLSAEIINYFSKESKTPKQLKKEDKPYTITWGKEKNKSKKISFRIIERYLKKNGKFDTANFSLPMYESFWLDSGIEMSINWHKFDHTATTGIYIEDGYPQQQYGTSFPIVPRINKEGILLSNFQPFLTAKIIANRKELVEESHLALTFDWFYKLKSLINDIVSLIDITLNQMYIKAQYLPKATWSFDESQLGSRNGRRLKDKLNWVYKITKNSLSIEPFKDSLKNLKEIRNHLNHFDPPTIAFHLEEVGVWLNQIKDIAKIIYDIRQKMEEPTSTKLMELLLQKDVIFIPEEEFKNRLPFDDNYGYESSKWK